MKTQKQLIKARNACIRSARALVKKGEPSWKVRIDVAHARIWNHKLISLRRYGGTHA